MALHRVKVENRDIEIESDVAGILVSETRFQDMENEIVQLHVENDSLEDTIRRLRQKLLGYELGAGILQHIDPLGDFENYPFSEN